MWRCEEVHSCCSHLDQRVGDLVVDLSCVCRGVVASEEKCSDGTLLCLLPVKHEGDGLPGAPVLFAGWAEEGHLVVDLVNVKNVFGLFLGEEITIVRPTSVTWPPWSLGCWGVWTSPPPGSSWTPACSSRLSSSWLWSRHCLESQK